MNRLLHTVLSHTSNLVVVINREGILDFASPSIKSALGYEPKSLFGKNWWEITRLNPTDMAQIKLRMTRFMDNSKEAVTAYEDCIKTKWGTVKYVQWDAIKIEQDQIVGIGKDITSQRKTELELLDTNKELRSLFNELKDSLNYASRLQKAILKNPRILSSHFNDAFVLYRPKEDISGDIYWLKEMGDFMFVALVDCTGHGAPGALLSIITNSLLKDIIVRRQILEPSHILKCLDTEFVNYLHENLSEGNIQDGMDISIMRYHAKSKTVCHCSANRPILKISKGIIEEWKPNKFSIGFQYDLPKTFDQHCEVLEAGDEVILFSDGFPDQFGGERGKKFNRKRFRQTLLDMHGMPGNEQEGYLDYTLKNWMQQEEQVDDVTVIGLKI